MNCLDAAQVVLAGIGTPMHVKDLTTEILSRGLWTTQGATPSATVNAQLCVDIKRRGPDSRFKKVAPATFALADGVPPAPTPTPTPAPILTSTPIPEPVQVGAPRSFTDAAEVVLESSTRKRPMHYKAITQEALSRGLIKTSGKTPASSMYAQILTETHKRQERGVRPRFVKHGKGMVGLSKWLSSDGKGPDAPSLPAQIDEHNRQVRQAVLEKIQKMHPTDFEALVEQLLTRLGFESDLTPPRA